MREPQIPQILSRLRACYRTQDYQNRETQIDWKFESLDVWRLGLLGASSVAPQGRSVFCFLFSAAACAAPSVLQGGASHPLRLRGRPNNKKARGNAYGPKTKKGNTMKKGLPYETQPVFYGWWSVR